MPSAKRPQIEWRDLVELRRWEIAKELLLPVPWLFASLWAGEQGWYGVMALCTFACFMVGLRVAHNAFHSSLGVSSLYANWVMFVLSVIMGGSVHAVFVTHLFHHGHCLAADDIEGHVAKMRFWEALFKSPLYPVRIHCAAIKQGSITNRRWIFAELACGVGMQCAVWWLAPSLTLQCFVSFMFLSNALAPMFGIWAVHRGCESESWQARTSRVRLLNLVVYGMFYHLEHHLYPAVPTCHLAKLARRFDVAHATQYKQIW